MEAGYCHTCSLSKAVHQSDSFFPNFCTAKVLERALHNQIQLHLMKYHLSSSHQSGFHTGYSTQDMILHVTDKWLKVVDEGNLLMQYF